MASGVIGSEWRVFESVCPLVKNMLRGTCVETERLVPRPSWSAQWFVDTQGMEVVVVRGIWIVIYAEGKANRIPNGVD